MFSKLYVTDAGICIYSHNFDKKEGFDEDLFTGFLSAIGSFAQEAFQTSLQTIEIQNGQKLVFFVEKEHKLTFSAIADTRDNNYLLERLLGLIAREFVTQKASILKSPNRDNLAAYEDFDQSLPEILKSTTRSRNKWSIVTGMFVGLLIMTIISKISETYIMGPIRENLSPEAGLMIFLASLCLMMLCSLLVSGYFAGNPITGVKTGIGLFIFLNLAIVIQGVGIYLDFLLISPFVVVLCVAAGYAGGLWCDRKKLYPLN